MEDQQKPFRSAANKLKDVYNSYIRTDEKQDDGTDPTVVATTNTDINDVHLHSDTEAHTEPSAVIEADAAEEARLLTKEVEELRAKLAATETERDEMKEKAIRTIAELENFRRRTDREKEQLMLYASEKTFSRLVEVLDDLHAALEAGKSSTDYTAMLSGLEMIYTKAHKLYEDHGVKPLIADSGTPFNVEHHEALMHIPHPETPEGHVVQQVRRGYILHDKVIRHAQVITSAGTGE